MAKAALDAFGKTLVTRVRDKSISEWKGIVTGHVKGETAEHSRALLKRPGTECGAAFVSLLPQVVDTVLHHLLWTLEQSEEITVAVQVGKERVENVNDASDGLSGELYGQEGWIAKFSKE